MEPEFNLDEGIEMPYHEDSDVITEEEGVEIARRFGHDILYQLREAVALTPKADMYWVRLRNAHRSSLVIVEILKLMGASSQIPWWKRLLFGLFRRK